jgi:hypothetical protein
VNVPLPSFVFWSSFAFGGDLSLLND